MHKLWQFITKISSAIWLASLPILRAEAVRLALVKLLGSAMAGGFRAWIIKMIVGHFYDEVAEKVALAGGYVYYKVDGKIDFKRLEKAETDEEKSAVIDDILS